MAKNLDRRKRKGIVMGIILVAMGVIFLLNNYGYTSFDFSRLWPIFLIIPGIALLFGLHNHD